jgi:hypothetical protein
MGISDLEKRILLEAANPCYDEISAVDLVRGMRTSEEDIEVVGVTPCGAL